MSLWSTALWLFWRLALLSPLAFGAGIAVSPELYRLLVTELGLLSHAQFAGAVALGQAAPGPNLIYVPLLGFQLAGLPGAVLALAGFLLPSGLLVVWVNRLGNHHADRPLVQALRVCLPPLTIGLLVSAGWLVAPLHAGWPYGLMTVVAAGVVWRTRIHLLWIVLAGALLGMLLALPDAGIS